MSKLSPLSLDFKFADNEKDVLTFWKNNNIYLKIEEKTKNGEEYDFMDGPPFPSSDTLHFGHVHIGIMKSSDNNYRRAHGKKVNNKIGYDCHGLPIEMVVSKIIGLKNNNEIKTYGIDKYNQKCEEVINSFSGAWENIYDRIARFVDFKNEYKTMDINFMETVWWAFRQLWDKNLVYMGYRIMPYSTECGTPLSASEASGDDVYKEVLDPAIYVKFQLKNTNDTYFIAWTTTPWTLPSNLALAMNPKMEYVTIKDLKTNDYYILAKNCIDNIYEKQKKKTEQQKPYQIIEQFYGEYFNNMEYEPMFSYFAKNRTFKVIMGDFVEEGSGTGIVHIAPAFGEDDFNACIKSNIVTVEDVGNYCPIDDNGHFIHPVDDYLGEKVLSTNDKIIKRLKDQNKLVRKEMYKHNYPHCWRTDTPLIYKAVSSFFIKVTSLRDKMVANNEKIKWVPETIGSGRFKQWIENAKDWGVSRSRFFGTPIPVWISSDGKEMICVGSIDELCKLAGLDNKLTNIHPQFIKDIKLQSREGRGELTWCGSVFDCWFESGCVPIGQKHYPFENSNYFDNKEYMCDFICEGLDQTRGWFYTLMVLSTALFDKPPFKNVICSGLILAEDGKKFSKRLGNFVHPVTVCNNYGTDALRLYLLGSPAAHADAFQFNEEKIKEILVKYYQWYNCTRLLIENIIKYTLDGNNFDVNAYKNSNNIMDKWILSRIGTLITKINNAMDNYTFYKVKPEILGFIEDLTNWYIKFNRNRLRGRDCDMDETGEALSTLYHVILMFTLISSPFIPFFTETLYQKLKVLLPVEQPESVHLCSYLLAKDFAQFHEAERGMKRLQMISCLVRSLRDKSTNATSVKVPLKTVTIVNEDEQFLNDLKLFERYFDDEINAMQLEYKTSFGIINYKLTPNHKEIGLLFRGQANEIKSKLSLVTQEEIVKYLNNKENGLQLNINNNTITINEPLFVVSKNHNITLGPNQMNIVENNTCVIVDFTQDEYVISSHILKLFVSITQKMRKKTSLKPWDKIGIYYSISDPKISNIIYENKDKLKQILLYDVNPIENANTNEKIIMVNTEKIYDSQITITLTQ
jgi:isoleucyl-tRNA synthetase